MITNRLKSESAILVFGITMVFYLVKSQVLWTSRQYQFTVHNVTTTWEEAQAICMSSGPGVSLLTVHDETAWNMWRHLLGPFAHNIRDYTGTYWFGIQTDTNDSDSFFWTGCEGSNYHAPLVPDFVDTGEPCVYMWINREIFHDVFQDKWFLGQNCSSYSPFICSAVVPEHDCFTRTCNDIVVQTNATDCSIELCYLFAPNATCSHSFMDTEQFCHLWTNTSDNITRTICFLPNNLNPVLYCPITNVPINYSVDVNSVNDSCPVPANISGLFDSHYYMYFERGTAWNSARDICDLHTGKLLTITDELDWHMWQILLSTRMLIDVEPWVGLHSPSPSISLDLVWDDCTNASFVVEGGALNATCVRITADGWVPTLCNESYPFICEFKTTTGASCLSRTCTEWLVLVNETECDTSLCGVNETCAVAYLYPISMCHIRTGFPANYSVLCLVLNYITDTCLINITESTEIYFTEPDDNPVVTDTKCSPHGTTTRTPPPQVSTASNGLCCCDALSSFLREPPPEEANLTVEEKIEKMVTELTVDKKNTTLNRMKYTSATDNRKSAVGIGAVAGAIIFSVLGVVVLIDLSRLFHEIQRFFRAMFWTLKSHFSNSKTPVESLGTHTANAGLSNVSSSVVSTSIGNNTVNKTAEMFQCSNDTFENIAPVTTVL